VAELSATGSASSSTFLRGDNSWQSAADATKLPLAGGTLTGAVMIGGTLHNEWHSDYIGLELGHSGFLYNRTSGNELFASSNAYYDSGWKYAASGRASMLDLQAGRIRARTSNASGSQDGAITFVTALDIAADSGAATFIGAGTFGGTVTALTNFNSTSGNDLRLNAGSANRDIFLQVNGTTLMTVQGSTAKVGIGETTPLGWLHVKEGDSGQGSVNSNFDQLVLEDDSHSGMTILSGTSADGGIYFGDSGGNNMGQFKYHHNGDYFDLTTANGAARVRIDAHGLKFHGDTAAANALDDYEEGTWTPALYTYSGVTTSSITTYGIYTKIGNICHIHAKITCTLSSLPGQTVTITGLPFAATNSADGGQRSIIAIGGDTQNTGGNTPKAHFRTDGSQLQGIYWNASNNTAYWTYQSFDSPTFEIHISGSYTT
jgi:hypothetical protein